MHDGVKLTEIDTAETDAAQGERSLSVDMLQIVVGLRGWGQVVNVPDSGVLTIGRSAACNVQVDDHALSRVHARLRREGSQILLSDLRSRNGIRIDGERVQEAQLAPTTIALLGHTTLCLLPHAAARGTGLAPQRSVTDVNLPQAALPTPAPKTPDEPLLAAANHERPFGKAMAGLFEMIRRVADKDIPVLIQGETGVGKELVATELHARSTRMAGPLRVVNCAAIPDTLMESVLFGHVKGAFTGADRAKKGIFEQAQGGTVFLDEIGELSLTGQAALLRVLDTGRLTAVGGDREVSLDVRVIAATHRDLEAMVENGQFRLDLLHRLNVVVLPVPPLRERHDELEPLVRYFLAQQQSPLRGQGYDITPDALACLCAHDFPGNIRELRNVVARAAALCEAHLISVADLPPHIQSKEPHGPLEEDLGGPDTYAGRPLSSRSQRGTVGLRGALAAHERDLITSALRQCHGNQRRAAVLLGLPLRTLERKVHKHGLSGGCGCHS